MYLSVTNIEEGMVFVPVTRIAKLSPSYLSPNIRGVALEKEVWPIRRCEYQFQ